ncbi:MAG: cache domain-containing protein [Patescibacteria group bacterium]|jgi:C4-dicarboxylate-specific signal transduction histidine kinase
MVKLTLKNKIIFTVAFSILIFGAVIVTAVSRYAKNNILAHKREYFNTALVAQTRETSRMILNSLNLVKTIAAQEKTVSYLGGGKIPQDSSVLEMLKQYNINGDYTAIYLMDDSGRVIATTDDRYLGLDLNFRGYFKNAMAGDGTIDLFTGLINKTIGYYFSFPVKDSDGRVIGVAAAKLKAGTINETISLEAEKEGANIMLTDRDGVVVFSNDSSRLYKSLGRLDPGKLEEISADQRYDGVVESVLPLNYDLIQQKISGISQSEIFEFTSSNDNRPKIAGLAKIDGFPFYLFVEEDLSNFSRSAAYLSFFLSGLIVLATALLVAIIYLILHGFLKPIARLKKFSHEISQGDFDESLELKTGDELEDLARSLNEMKAKLKNFYGNLQKEIKEEAGMIRRKTREAQLKGDELAETRKNLHNILKKKKIPLAGKENPKLEK